MRSIHMNECACRTHRVHQASDPSRNFRIIFYAKIWQNYFLIRFLTPEKLHWNLNLFSHIKKSTGKKKKDKRKWWSSGVYFMQKCPKWPWINNKLQRKKITFNPRLKSAETMEICKSNVFWWLFPFAGLSPMCIDTHFITYWIGWTVKKGVLFVVVEIFLFWKGR